MNKKSFTQLVPARRSPGEGGFFSPRVVIALVISIATCSILTVPLLAFLHPQAPSNASQRTLSLEERVSYQRAIEDVYWRHRVWPKERKDPKPSLDAVMSQAQLEKKVTDYRRKSQALEDYWQRPITAGQLQAEIDRMAKHTRQPEVLSELFEALGNDPFVIAECLARPALADRLLTNWYAYDQRIHGELKQRAEAELQAHPPVGQMKQLSGKYSEMEFAKSDNAEKQAKVGARHAVKLNSQEWDDTVQKLAAAFGVRRRVAAFKSANMSALSKKALAENDQTLPIRKLSSLQEDETRYYATVVIEKTNDHLKLATVSWLKEPFESWRGRTENSIPSVTAASSASYKLPMISGGGCINDTWTATAGPPDARAGHTAVWTGSEMIIWGGFAGVDVNTGSRYNPTTDTWMATSTVNAPDPRSSHTAVWTGSEMIVWGGIDDSSFNVFNTGGRYDPITDSWIATNTTNAPDARYIHAAVWSGSEMIVWGGTGANYFNTGGRYNPNTDSWTATNITNAPTGRYAPTAVWTGNEMIVWGGTDDSAVFNTGGRYNPATNSWTSTTTNNAPTGRVFHTAVWTGTEMIVWGGTDIDNSNYFNTGGRYNPATNSWAAATTNSAPSGRDGQTAVWTGSQMIIWGGYDASSPFLDTGGSYDPSTNTWTATSTSNAPSARDGHRAVWAGTEMIVWGGADDSGVVDTGGRYNPTSNSWVNTTTYNVPTGRYLHAAVWTGSEMIVWGGLGVDYFNTGGRYNPGIDSWTATSTANAPAGRYLHTAVWTGSEMIVWGGSFFDGVFHYFNTGGRYNPAADGWTATSTASSPTARDAQTAVWTGSEMIVWGGESDSGLFNTGGKYNPSTNNWTAISTANAPTGRLDQTAVWTGSEMMIWGGFDKAVGYCNTGGKYNPSANSWTATNTIGAPAPRALHTAVSSGSGVIIWGGTDGSSYFNTGGRYDPGTDIWTATSVTNAPVGRWLHAAVWTGSEMIVWGGDDENSVRLNTGGRYNPPTDSWIGTSTSNAPEARDDYKALWTGSEMIVWGGFGASYLNSGGSYCAQGGPIPTPTPTPSVSPTPSPTPTPTPTPRVTPRPRPTPHGRPTPR
jgi:N-acetylneuraminic acid mutarotase